jgi:hypothetical protein
MVWDPPVRVDVVTLATPPVTFTVPRLDPPSENVTVPVTDEGRVAVNVTDWPMLDGLTDETREMLGTTFDTIWTVEAVPGLLLLSPL